LLPGFEYRLRHIRENDYIIFSSLHDSLMVMRIGLRLADVPSLNGYAL
jgi:hypothetical protein